MIRVGGASGAVIVRTLLEAGERMVNWIGGAGNVKNRKMGSFEGKTSLVRHSSE